LKSGAKRKARTRIHPNEIFVFGVLAVALSLPVLTASLAMSDSLINGHFHFLPCVQKTVFHRECLTCGMTRSFGAMWKGNIKLAREFNRGGPATFTGFWIMLFLGLGLICQGRFHGSRNGMEKNHENWRSNL
jgi:hypothetical protein